MTSAQQRGRRDPHGVRKLFLLLLVAVASLLVFAPPAHAYVGPGAGFAVVSSLLTWLLATLQAIFAFLTWPIRQFFRFLRHRRAYRKAQTRRTIILGFDGMDPVLTERFMKQGKLPNLARLRQTGTFQTLATTLPPISPVAWSSFLTGVNPGKHNIYDFVMPDRRRYLPELSSARIRGPRRYLNIGRYKIPLGRARISPLRKSTPFWHYLAKAGVSCSIIRVPVTFPPEKFPGLLLSGMCVPDIQGTQGTFSFHTTRNSSEETGSNRVVVPFAKHNEWFYSHIPGPPDPLRTDSGAELRAPFSVKAAASGGEASIRIDGQRISISEGKYSEWVELKFHAGIGPSIKGICRFYLKSVEPHLELYVTPVNIHPMHPALPISHPLTYSVYLAKLNGLYATLGLAEDTWALNDGFLTEDAFLDQCYLIHEERERMFFDSLEKTAQGVCICVFDITDRVQHMFWRHLPKAGDPRAETESRATNAIEALYVRMDQLIGRTIDAMSRDDLLLIVSDHGFKGFERGVNLNSWLHQHGYLSLREGAPSGDWFRDVDWTKTRAYSLGLNGIYLNVKGRESMGAVEPGSEAARLRAELCERLQGLTDPENSRVAILRAFDAMKAYRGPYRENAPDVIVGFGEGYRASWDSAQGRVTSAVFDVNSKAWSGDHCIDPGLVPGILFSNWKIAGERHAITDIAPTLLSLFGVQVPLHMDGKAWAMTPSASRLALQES
ncbi:MAG TPA: alkaline phosphatase family protein [Candidatus Acidoferrum sp.]|nr:alkaline phosphatase family protein [Candidatus Acidoferrum sp.]